MIEDRPISCPLLLFCPFSFCFHSQDNTEARNIFFYLQQVLYKSRQPNTPPQPPKQTKKILKLLINLLAPQARKVSRGKYDNMYGQQCLTYAMYDGSNTLTRSSRALVNMKRLKSHVPKVVKEITENSWRFLYLQIPGDPYGFFVVGIF